MRATDLLVAFAVGAPLEAQTLHYEGSAGLATGSYIFTTRTSSWQVSTGLALGAGPGTFRAPLAAARRAGLWDVQPVRRVLKATARGA